MSPSLEAYLRRKPLNDAQRADLWDAFESAKDHDELATALQAMKVPNDVKADLWDMKAAGGGTAPTPAPEAKPPSTAEKVGNFALGAAKGYGESMAQTMRPLMGVAGLVTPSQVTEALTPTDAEKPGYYAEGVAESIVPAKRAVGAARAAASGLGGKVVRAVVNPVGGAVAGGAVRAAMGGDAVDIAQGAAAGAGLATLVPGASRSLGARLKHMIGQAAKEEPAVVKAAENIVIPEGRVIGATGQRIAEAQIARAAELARGAKGVAPAANVVVPATRAGVPGGEAAAEAIIAKAAESAKGTVPQAVKRAPRPARASKPSVSVEEMTPLEGQLKASVLPKAEMALEVERKVLLLRTQQGLSNAQVTATLRELYGIPQSYGKQMVEMILKTHGLK